MKTIIVLSSILLGLAATTIQAAKLDRQLYAKYLCRDKEDGFKALVPGSCSQYYECQNSAAQLRACPRFFDALNQICVTKDTGCVETLASAVNVPAGCSGPCCGVSGGYALDPVNDQVYYECKDNCVISKNSCEDNMMFNLETLKCSAAASCGEVTTPKPPCTKTTTPPCTTTTCTITTDITTTGTKTTTTKTTTTPNTTTTTCTTTTCTTTEDITTTGTKTITTKSTTTPTTTTTTCTTTTCTTTEDITTTGTKTTTTKSTTKPTTATSRTTTTCTTTTCTTAEDITATTTKTKTTKTTTTPNTTKTTCTTTTCTTTEDITTTGTKTTTTKSTTKPTTTTTTCTTTTCTTAEDITATTTKTKTTKTTTTSSTTTTCTTTIEAPCDTTTKAPCTEATTTKAPCPLANAVALNQPEPSKEPSKFNLYIRFVCRDKADGFKLVSLTNCNDFYVCSKGVAMPLSCGDKYFNAVKGVCDLPQNTNCHLKTVLA